MGWVARVVGVVSVVAVLGACVFDRPKLETVFPADELHSRALPVRLHDLTGMVQAIQAVAWQRGAPGPGGWEDQPVNVDGEPRQVLITWMGGACEDAVRLDLRADGPGLILTVTDDNGFVLFGRSCPAIAIGRTLAFTFTEPVDAASIQLERG